VAIRSRTSYNTTSVFASVMPSSPGHPVSGIIEQVTTEPQELRVATKRSAAPAVAEAIVRSSVAALVISLATRPPFRTR